MAFIKDSERKKLIKKTEQKYGVRKFLITLELILLLGFMAIVFTSLYMTEAKHDETWQWITSIDPIKLTPLGIGIIVWAVVVVGLGIASLVLTWTLKSPKQIKENLNKLNSSALSGKRIKGKKAVEVTRSRTTIKKEEDKK